MVSGSAWAGSLGPRTKEDNDVMLSLGALFVAGLVPLVWSDQVPSLPRSPRIQTKCSTMQTTSSRACNGVCVLKLNLVCVHDHDGKRERENTDARERERERERERPNK